MQTYDANSDSAISSILTEQTGLYVFAMPVLDSRMYVFSSPDKKILIIDPNLVSDEDKPHLEAICAEASHATILVTHSHYDHIAGLNFIRELVPSTVYATPLCNEKMQDPHKNLSAYSMALVMGKTEERQRYCEECFDFDYSCKADIVQEAPFEVDFGDYLLRVIATPGHSDCSMCIELRLPEGSIGNSFHAYDVQRNATIPTQNSSDLIQDFNHLTSSTPLAVFTGDSLVNGHDVITRFPTGSKTDYQRYAKPYLDSLNKNILVFPGHGEIDILKNLESFKKIFKQ